jgi:hypothetical protein
VLYVFVEHGLFPDLAALEAGFYGAQDAAAVADGFEFFQHGFFDQVGEFVGAGRSPTHVLDFRLRGNAPKEVPLGDDKCGRS